MESPSHDSVLRPPRPAAGALRLSSSFKPLSEAARASGATTPTGILLGKASDIIISGIERGFDEECTTPHSVGLANSTGRKLRSCLSLGRHSDSPVPPASTAATYSAEPKGLHWKPELVAVSAADQSFKSHDLQARCMKLEAELQESEAARALLQKQLHRVQDAMKQNRTNLEDAQRVALAAEAKTAAAEAKAASLTREVCACKPLSVFGTQSCYLILHVAACPYRSDNCMLIRQRATPKFTMLLTRCAGKLKVVL